MLERANFRARRGDFGRINQHSPRCVPPPSDIRLQRSDPRSSRVRAAAAQSLPPIAPSSHACPSPRNPITGIASCCPRAASHAAAPPRAASNSRPPIVTVMRPSRARVRRCKDTTPRARCPNCVATGAGGAGAGPPLDRCPGHAPACSQELPGHGLHCARGDANSALLTPVAVQNRITRSCAVSGIVVFAIATPAANFWRTRPLRPGASLGSRASACGPRGARTRASTSRTFPPALPRPS
jgi:hypothetical protein